MKKNAPLHSQDIVTNMAPTENADTTAANSSKNLRLNLGSERASVSQVGPTAASRELKRDLKKTKRLS